MKNNILSPSQIYDEVITIGIKKAKNPNSKATFLSAILAGAFISLGGFASMVASHSISNYGISKLVSGMVFPVGLILVLICGAELFTGNSLLMIAHAESKISTKDLVKNLSTVYLGNLLGASIVAIFLFTSNAFMGNGGQLAAYALKIANGKASLSFPVALSSGILCNFLVSIAVWGSYGAKDVIGKIFMAFFPIMAFIVSGFEHSVANMYYFVAGILVKLNPELVQISGLSQAEITNINIASSLGNLIPVTIGNLISGMVFVGLVYRAIYGTSKVKVTSELEDTGLADKSSRKKSDLNPKHA